MNLPALLDALKPFLAVEESTHESEFTPELDDEDYISVYYAGIRAKHFRALRKALES